MVTKKSITLLTIITIVLLTPFFALSIPTVQAQQIEYHLDHEWAKIWINEEDGTIDLLYDIKITCDQGTINYVNVGQPTGEFTIGKAQDENGNSLQTEDVSTGKDYKVRVHLNTPITTGESVRFTLTTTNIKHMILEDEQNPGNVGMVFIPVYWDANVNELRVLIVTPPGVTTGNVRNSPDWDNAYNDPHEDDRLVIYWERSNLSPNEQFECGVSFPKQYVQHYEKREKGLVLFFKRYGGIIAFFALFFGMGVVIYKGVKRSYAIPSLRLETLGIRRGLTAVEASWLLDLPPTKIVTEILYSLLMKKAIWVTATEPALKLKVMEPFQDKTGTPETPLRFYEIDFLEAIKPDGTLSEEKLAKTVMFLGDNVEEKIRGYCRRDTIEYYRNIVVKAWGQVEQAGTPELASKAYDENLLWLLIHDDFSTRTKDVFHERIFTPKDDWWWYWYGYTYYHPRPTYKPSPTTTKPAAPPTIPGAEFANNVVTSIEKTSNNIVANIEKFADSIIPRPPPSARTSTSPVRQGSSCACACVSCACVCACASCACACASGGVG